MTTPVLSEQLSQALPEDPSHSGVPENDLERAIGRQIRAFRGQLDMTGAQLARKASLSAGMLSKIENGVTSPSLATLKLLSQALQVPVTSFFRKYEEARDVTYVPAGEGLTIERRGTRAGHQYQLLGHNVSRQMFVEPYLITLTDEADVFPLFQHGGMEFLHMLKGRMAYRHGDRTFPMGPGDSLFFDADAPHGPEQLKELPIEFLSVLIEPRPEGQ